MNKNYQKLLSHVKNAGFTLIELLVVVLIIGILAAIAVPQYQKAVYTARMVEVEGLMTAAHQARLVHQMSTGAAVPLSYDELDISLPAHCKENGLDSSGPYMGWLCNKVEFTMIPTLTLARIWSLGGCTYCHFDKLYPSGKFRCRERGDTLFSRYCKSKGYEILEIAPK